MPMVTTLLALALQLLIAAQQPNVPNELRLQAISVATFAIQYARNPQTPTFGNTGSATIPVMTPTNLPAYPTDRFDSSFPVSVYPSATSVTFQLERDSKNWGDVVFNGKTILTKDSDPTWAEVDDLTPATSYEYTFIFHEAGRDDTVITKTFRTKVK